jgi:hypothetical protein
VVAHVAGQSPSSQLSPKQEGSLSHRVKKSLMLDNVEETPRAAAIIIR